MTNHPSWLRPLGMGNKTRAVIIGRAIARLADEHGLPNSFSVGEIAAAEEFKHSALLVGRILQDRFTLPVVIDALAAKGIRYLRYRRAGGRDGRSYVDVEALR